MVNELLQLSPAPLCIAVVLCKLLLIWELTGTVLYTLTTDDVWTKYSDAEIHGLIPHMTQCYTHLHAMLYI